VGKLLDEMKGSTKRSKVDQMVEDLGEEGEDLLVALRDPLIPLARIREVLAGRGVVVSASTLSVWRREHGVA
jgi:hypothetical protein